jgi:hypothetical protein
MDNLGLRMRPYFNNHVGCIPCTIIIGAWNAPYEIAVSVKLPPAKPEAYWVSASKAQIKP